MSSGHFLDGCATLIQQRSLSGRGTAFAVYGTLSLISGSSEVNCHMRRSEIVPERLRCERALFSGRADCLGSKPKESRWVGEMAKASSEAAATREGPRRTPGGDAYDADKSRRAGDGLCHEWVRYEHGQSSTGPDKLAYFLSNGREQHMRGRELFFLFLLRRRSP